MATFKKNLIVSDSKILGGKPIVKRHKNICCPDTPEYCFWHDKARRYSEVIQH